VIGAVGEVGSVDLRTDDVVGAYDRRAAVIPVSGTVGVRIAEDEVVFKVERCRSRLGLDTACVVSAARGVIRDGIVGENHGITPAIVKIIERVGLRVAGKG